MSIAESVKRKRRDAVAQEKPKIVNPPSSKKPRKKTNTLVDLMIQAKLSSYERSSKKKNCKQEKGHLHQRLMDALDQVDEADVKRIEREDRQLSRKIMTLEKAKMDAPRKNHLRMNAQFHKLVNRLRFKPNEPLSAAEWVAFRSYLKEAKHHDPSWDDEEVFVQVQADIPKDLRMLTELKDADALLPEENPKLSSYYLYGLFLLFNYCGRLTEASINFEVVCCVLFKLCYRAKFIQRCGYDFAVSLCNLSHHTVEEGETLLNFLASENDLNALLELFKIQRRRLPGRIRVGGEQRAAYFLRRYLASVPKGFCVYPDLPSTMFFVDGDDDIPYEMTMRMLKAGVPSKYVDNLRMKFLIPFGDWRPAFHQFCPQLMKDQIKTFMLINYRLNLVTKDVQLLIAHNICTIANNTIATIANPHQK